MTAPQPDDPPLIGSVCASWAQMHELPADVQQYHTPDVWCSILALASDILWGATGRRWRNVEASETVTLDPPEGACSTQLGHAYHYGYWLPMRAVGSCPVRVRLPRPDVTAITAAEVGEVAFTAYRRNGNYAIRTDGGGWPMSSSTRITYDFGRLVPHTGKLAAIALAGELGKAFAGQKCALPARVTSVVRQGISWDALESLEYLDKGLTGLYAVDNWVISVNPYRSKQSGRVWSPDTIYARQV